MVVISFNSYPIFDALGHPLKWLFLLAPLTAVGVIPSRYLLRPDFETLAAELVAAALIAIGGVLIFRTGLRRYQSTPTFVGQRL